MMNKFKYWILSLVMLVYLQQVLPITIKTSTEITDASVLDTPEVCCECDFFITQTAVGGKNHPIASPITQSGTYCLAENVTGTIVIQTSNVTLDFKGYTLAATGVGVSS